MTKKRRRPLRGGMALVIVVAAMAVAAILGYAMLSGAALQSDVADSAAKAAQADALAESGVSLAMYYLQNPNNAPTLKNGFWPGASGITLNSATAANQSINVTITGPTGTTSQPIYSITSTGVVSSPTEPTLTRTVVASVQVNLAYQIMTAVGSNSAITILTGAQIKNTGSPPIAIETAGLLTIPLGVTVTGNVLAGSRSILGTVTGAILGGPSSSPAPTAANVNHYLTYTYQNATYNAHQLANSTLNTDPGATFDATNPAKVFYYVGNGTATSGLTVAGNVTVHGTLIVQKGTLFAQSPNNVITPTSGFPAVVADQYLQINGAGAGLTINGTVWLGQGITGHGLTATSAINITGALLTDTAALNALYLGGLKVTYDSTLSSAPALTSTGAVPQSLRMLSWSNQ
jgi:hypothetical protein